MLEIEALNKEYKGKVVLSNVSLRLAKKRITGLVGVNGSGKSTLLGIIAGFLPPGKHKNTKILFNEQDIYRKSPAYRNSLGISYMPQQGIAIRNITVAQMLDLNSEHMANPLTTDLIHSVGLHNVVNRRIDNLSFGEVKKLEIALCLQSRPKLALLDEPFAGLDPKTSREIIRLLKEFHAQGIDFLIADHRVEILKEIAAEFLLIEKGGIIGPLSVGEFFSSTVVKANYL